MPTYRLAKKHELHEVAALLTQSFLDYPLFSQLLSSSGDLYQKQIFQLNWINTKLYAQQNSCFVGVVDGQIVSVMLLKKGGSTSPGLWQYIRSGGLKLASLAGIPRALRIVRTLDAMKQACKPYDQESWYVDSIAVAKHMQGQSLGSALFHSFLFPYIRKHGGGMITLVTHTESNKKFYCKNGFEVFSEYLIGASGKEITNYSFRQVVT
ncbi:N-acetyltransferase [Saccharibacillus sp. JS10]|uniref:GNAT family N-acetyltransferase n=1 Tax=Saccharibacillus sp. JS10 TaxID=2950552 RepID=UPI00210DD02F|nr:GNAT family N-acetyltransferase [Saccharibacillus sp. JS10]MCQ4087590.1 GNAT family N-acetyltransferase [Saccharibacillus sp. JS10]